METKTNKLYMLTFDLCFCQQSAASLDSNTTSRLYTSTKHYVSTHSKLLLKKKHKSNVMLSK